MAKKSGVEGMTKAELLMLVRKLNNDLGDAREKHKILEDIALRESEEHRQRAVDLHELREHSILLKGCYHKACGKIVVLEEQLERRKAALHIVHNRLDFLKAHIAGCFSLADWLMSQFAVLREKEPERSKFELAYECAVRLAQILEAVRKT